MPTITQDHDPLSRYREGLSAQPLDGGASRHPCPLVATAIDVSLTKGFASVATSRTFTNIEPVAIEATLTFPVPTDAVLHGLTVVIDGRTLVAVAEAREKARASYEASIDKGTMAVLHEEVLLGVHMVSIGQLAPGATCIVTDTWSTITSASGAGRRLRIPTTVGAVYGRLPLNPADDLLPGQTRRTASVTIATDGGIATLLGAPQHGPAGVMEVDLGHAIDIVVAGGALGPIAGKAAGRRVTLEIAPAPRGDAPLDLAILFDRSSSTEQPVRADGAATVWSAMRDGLRTVLQGLRDGDAVTLYDFHSTPALVGKGRGPQAATLADRVGRPTGGTEIGSAIALAIAEGATDILLLTDGRSGALDVHRLAQSGLRVSALLVGPDSLEAMMGRLAAASGGQIACASGTDAGERLASLVAALRKPPRPRLPAADTAMPDTIADMRGGSLVTAAWSDDKRESDDRGPVDAVGAFAAAMALPALTQDAAIACALAHGLCTHLTSLVIVDAAGSVQDAVPETRKVASPQSYQPHAYASAARIDAYPAMAAPAASYATGDCYAPTEASALASESAGFDTAPMRRAWNEGAEEPRRPSRRETSAESPMRKRSFLARLFAPASRRRRGPDHATPEPRPGTTDGERTTIDLRATGLRIDWSAQAGPLAAGTLDGLDPASRLAIEAAARTPAILLCATSLAAAARSRNATPMAIAIAAAIAALAVASTDRSAARLARRIAEQVGQDKFERLAAQFGLVSAAA